MSPKYLSKSGNLKSFNDSLRSEPSSASLCNFLCAKSAFCATLSIPESLIFSIFLVAASAASATCFIVFENLVPSRTPSCVLSLCRAPISEFIEFLASLALDTIRIFKESMFIVVISIKRSSDQDHCSFFFFDNSKFA